MDSTRIQHGQTERILTTILRGDGTPYTGLTDVTLEIQRRSDGKYFDFTGSTFKSSGWTTRQGVMTELDATNSPGAYYYNFDTTPHSAAYTEEDYYMRTQSVTAGTAINEGELHVGGYVNQIGVFEGGGRGGYEGLSKKQMIELAKMVWEVILKGKESAKEVLLSRSEFDSARDKVILKEKIDFKPVIKPVVNIPEAPPVKDYTPELRQIFTIVSELYVPQQHDYSGELAELAKQIMDLKNPIYMPILDDIKESLEEILDAKDNYQKQGEIAKAAADRIRDMVNELESAKEIPEPENVEAPLDPPSLDSRFTENQPEELKL
jgi:hypothetical protein